MNPLNLLLLGIAMIAICFYVQGLRVRELAIAAAHHYCKRHNLQLLDQSVHLKKVRLRNASGLCVHRQYNFDFSATGDERYQGYITMNNKHVGTVWVPAHRIPENISTLSNDKSHH